MISKNNIEMGARYYGEKAITVVYKGAKLVWEAIASCFGGGMWLNNRAWKNTDGWKNN